MFAPRVPQMWCIAPPTHPPTRHAAISWTINLGVGSTFVIGRQYREAINAIDIQETHVRNLHNGVSHFFLREGRGAT